MGAYTTLLFWVVDLTKLSSRAVSGGPTGSARLMNYLLTEW